MERAQLPFDSLWLEAPAPALTLRQGAPGVAWRLNRAAVEWSLDAAASQAAWQKAADELFALLPATTHGELRLGPASIRWSAVAVDAAWVVWLTPLTTGVPAGSSGWGDIGDRLELMQEFGRMGLFERDIATGEGRWDKHMFRLLGIDPVIGTPPFALATERIHPDDRERVRQQHLEFISRAGRYENRYRLLLPGNVVRDIHSLVEVRERSDGSPGVMIGVLIDDSDSAARVRAQQARSAKLAEALDLAGVSVWRIDLQRETIEYNRTGAVLTGQSPEHLTQPLSASRELIHPADRELVEQAAAAAIAGTEAIDVVARYRHTAGHFVHLLTRRVAERDDTGRVVALAGISIDQSAQVAERERAQALRRSVELVADAAGVGLWSVDLESNQVEWNPQMMRIYGLPENAAAPTLQRWVGALVHTDDRERLARRRRESIKAGQRGFEIDFRVVRPDGQVRWVVCRSTNEVREGRPMLVGIHLDVTDRRATEEELRRQQERLAMATSAAEMGIWERDADARITFWDPQMYRLRGLDPADPRAVDEIARGSTSEAKYEELQRNALRSIRSGLGYEHELRVVWPDGTEHWLVTVGKPLRDEQGRGVGMIGVNFDVTQRRQAEQALRDKETAERASRSKSEFLARMSHELRTPLNAVLGFAQLIENDGVGLALQQLDRVARIRTAGQHLLSLIEDVLDLSSVEAGTLPMSVESVPLDAAVAEVRAWVAPLAERQQVTLHLPATAAHVSGDPRRIRQILANLLTNAVKYNRAGGNVWLDVQSAGSAERPQWEIAIRDDGRGLTREQREHLFEPFNRLGAERDGIEGVGLGLMVVRHLVEYMGGSIGVDSEIGRGTTMRLRLPLALPGVGTAASPEAAVIDAAAEGPGLSILYIEDNAVNVLLVEELVALRPGMVVSSAVDGISGVAAALAAPPDVVLIDMQLPDIDGYEVLRRLRAEPRMAASSMIALSANAMPEDVARALASGFNDYWTKPIDFGHFLGGLDALARARRH